MDRVLGLLAKAGRANALAQHADEEPPLRAELFSVEQMEQHGRNLAVAHRLAADRAPDRLLPRLADNEAILAGVRDLLTVEVTEGRRIAPAAEWLIDNFYLIDEQIRTAKRHLPQGYSRELPRLAKGPSAGAYLDWNIRLAALEPYPVTGRGIPSADYVATLVVSCGPTDELPTQ